MKDHTGLKLIYNVLYILEINQNMLSVTQLLEKGYRVLFEGKNYVIKNVKDIKVFKVQMKDKSFALYLKKKKQIALHKEKNNSVLWHKRMKTFPSFC